jgi:GxxExxY protein
MNENEIGSLVVDTAVEIHKDLVPGLLESVYEAILAHELQRKGLSVKRQVVVPIVFRGMRFDEGFRADLIVEGNVVVELKSVDSINRAH